MCGFCGFTGQIATPEEILEKMKNKIIHRGPDSGGSHIDNGIAMGFRRLSFLDLEGGHQPIYNETRDMVITFNGEIYNHQEIREELIAKGHVMGSGADTEVLIHGYEEWGVEILQKLRGLFAFVIWDKKTKHCLVPVTSSASSLFITQSQTVTSSMVPKSNPFWNTLM